MVLLLNEEECKEVLTDLVDYYDNEDIFKSEVKRYADEFFKRTGRIPTSHDIATDMVNAGCFAVYYTDQAQELIKWGFSGFKTVKEFLETEENGEEILKLYAIPVGEALEYMLEGV